ncbi:hypothetical protein D3C73_1245930 [compost metagenome]
MKSMSIDSQGMSRLNCVWKCKSGFCNCDSPLIHIFAGEKVCIQVMTPAQDSSPLASSNSLYISSGVVTIGLNTIGYEKTGSFDSCSAIMRECSATSSNVSGPYKCWLPVTNQNEYGFNFITQTPPINNCCR